MGGELVGLTIVGDTEDPVKTVNLTQEKINSLIGIDIAKAEVEKSLESLGFKLVITNRSNNNSSSSEARS